MEDNGVFEEAEAGYENPKPLEVTVTNIGYYTTNSMLVELWGGNADRFTLSTDALADIARGKADCFTVTPKTGLPVGAYTATVMVRNAAVEGSVDVSFAVKAKTPIEPPEPVDPPKEEPTEKPTEKPTRPEWVLPSDDNDDDSDYDPSPVVRPLALTEKWMTAANLRNPSRDTVKFGVRVSAWNALTGNYYHDSIFGTSLWGFLKMNPPSSPALSSNASAVRSLKIICLKSLMFRKRLPWDR